MLIKTVNIPVGTHLFTRLHGRLVGKDQVGNRYYEERRKKRGATKCKRWVMYAGRPDASAVPPEWHLWLHYTVDTPLLPASGAWQKPHQPNKTGTVERYNPYDRADKKVTRSKVFTSFSPEEV